MHMVQSKYNGIFRAVRVTNNAIDFSMKWLDIHSDDVRCKWSIRHSNPTTIVRQCMCGGYRVQALGPASRISTARYPYVECLSSPSSFVTAISVGSQDIWSIQNSVRYPCPDETLYIGSCPVRKSVENLLSECQYGRHTCTKCPDRQECI